MLAKPTRISSRSPLTEAVRSAIALVFASVPLPMASIEVFNSRISWSRDNTTEFLSVVCGYSDFNALIPQSCLQPNQILTRHFHETYCRSWQAINWDDAAVDIG
jgi:hypothetical protein